MLVSFAHLRDLAVLQGGVWYISNGENSFFEVMFLNGLAADLSLSSNA